MEAEGREEDPELQDRCCRPMTVVRFEQRADDVRRERSEDDVAPIVALEPLSATHDEQHAEPDHQRRHVHRHDETRRIVRGGIAALDGRGTGSFLGRTEHHLAAQVVHSGHSTQGRYRAASTRSATARTSAVVTSRVADARRHLDRVLVGRGRDRAPTGAPRERVGAAHGVPRDGEPVAPQPGDELRLAAEFSRRRRLVVDPSVHSTAKSRTIPPSTGARRSLRAAAATCVRPCPSTERFPMRSKRRAASATARSSISSVRSKPLP